MRAAGLTTSLAPMTSTTSVSRELVVDLVHLVQPVVRDVGLGEQHVHVAGHAAGHRMDRVFHLAAALLDQLGQLAHLVLACATAIP